MQILQKQTTREEKVKSISTLNNEPTKSNITEGRFSNKNSRKYVPMRQSQSTNALREKVAILREQAAANM